MSAEVDQSASRFGYSAISGLILAAEIDVSLLPSEGRTCSMKKTVELLHAFWDGKKRYIGA